jgi:hypothetical protein
LGSAIPGGAVIGAVLGGAIGSIGGYLNKSKIEKEAKWQKDMLDWQAEQARLLEIGNKNQQTLQNYLLEGSRFGTAYAGRDLPMTLKSVTGTGTHKTAISATKISDMERSHTLAQKQLIGYSAILNEYEFSKNKQIEIQKEIDAIVDKTPQQTQADVSGKNKEQTREIILADATIDESIANLKAEKDAYSKAEAELLVFMSTLKESRNLYFKEWFGFSHDITRNEAGEITDVKTVWNTRSDILNSFIENASSGFSNLGSIIADTFSTGYMNAFVKEGNEINKLLNKIENSTTKMLADMISDKNVFEILQADVERLKIIKELKEKRSKTTNNWEKAWLTLQIARLKDSMDGVGVIFQQIVTDTQSLKLEQEKVTNATQQFNKAWIDAGGTISDIKNNLFPSLYSEMTNIFKADTYEDGLKSFGDFLFNSISDKRIQQTLDQQFSDSAVKFNSLLTTYTMGGMNIKDTQSLINEARILANKYESGRQQISNLRDMLDFNSAIEYQSANSNVEYTTGSSISNVINNYMNFSVPISDSIGFNDTIPEAVINKIVPYVKEALTKTYG